ncbi:hypothetical protein McanMca71_002546 [Microsporum canis]|uniref:Uncharacterized protein n=1 Tax=Arthroderma otae (strain ATCC MYA-4605 / CBS 113480) TaxID=554155 RepID=C5FY69_ARTOC|nr:uncharacterized protein MCYG_07286 [Microsporum canis CBS 113480]EEQ34467.1 hypothetical protein MCYG_07286 [Microsporum canis CBS 113480]
MGGFEQNESAESHLAKAFKDIARGEQTAEAIENHLTRIEQEIDRLLGSVEAAKEGTEAVTKDDKGNGEAEGVKSADKCDEKEQQK